MTTTKRIKGPTPNGGAYAIAVTDDEGNVEVTEYDPGGNVVGRTYGSTHESEDDDAGASDPGVAPPR